MRRGNAKGKPRSDRLTGEKRKEKWSCSTSENPRPGKGIPTSCSYWTPHEVWIHLLSKKVVLGIVDNFVIWSLICILTKIVPQLSLVDHFYK